MFSCCQVGEKESGGDLAVQAQAARETGRGTSRARASSGRRKVTYGFHLVEGRMPHGMEDRHVAEFRQLDDGNEVGLFAVFDGHSGADVATYLREHLFDNILNEVTHALLVATYCTLMRTSTDVHGSFRVGFFLFWLPRFPL